MKIQTSPNGFDIAFPGGGSGTIKLSDIHSIDIETLPTMSVDVDYVTVGFSNGEFVEISDDTEGFQDFCAELSKGLLIDPPIHHRFPVVNEKGMLRVYERA